MLEIFFGSLTDFFWQGEVAHKGDGKARNSIITLGVVVLTCNIFRLTVGHMVHNNNNHNNMEEVQQVEILGLCIHAYRHLTVQFRGAPAN